MMSKSFSIKKIIKKGEILKPILLAIFDVFVRFEVF